MPLYRPEQLHANGADIGRIERVFLFSTDVDADIVVDTTQAQPRKIDACVAHRSQFPQGIVSLDWLKEMDGRHGVRIGAAAAESFAKMGVW